MGSPIEINDTLKISIERGFPLELNLKRFLANPEYVAKEFIGKEFEFWNKDERLYHRPPTRAWLVQEMPDGKWIFWGHCMILSQIIGGGKTSGRYKIDKIYHPEFQKQFTINESPKDKSYFEGPRDSFNI